MVLVGNGQFPELVYFLLAVCSCWLKSQVTTVLQVPRNGWREHDDVHEGYEGQGDEESNEGNEGNVSGPGTIDEGKGTDPDGGLPSVDCALCQMHPVAGPRYVA